MKKDRLSYSALSNFCKSPNHILAYWEDVFEPTTAMLFGKMVHCLILEPEVFANEYSVYEGTRRGKVWEEFKGINETKNIVTVKEYNHASKIFREAKKNPLFNDLLMRTSETEKHIEWDCEGVKYHGYVDMIGDNFIADIKTTTDAGEKFARDLKYNDYKMQGAMYLEAFKDKDYYIIAIEKGSPYNVQVYKLGTELLVQGYNKYRYFNKKYIEWSGEPESYSPEIITVGGGTFQETGEHKEFQL